MTVMPVWCQIYLFAFLAGAVSTLFDTPVFGRIARKFDFMDRPQANHKGHGRATPLLGGAAMFTGWLFCLAAGLDGIRRNLTPPSSTDGNIFELTGDEREERDIHSLPSNLKEAVRAMRRDDLVRETLGEHIFSKYVEHKTEEWDEYKIRVTPWELDRYLERY